MPMKNKLLVLLFVAISATAMSQTAVDFTANDCSGTSHNLFTELDAGKIIVLVWVMPCSSCIAPSLTTYNVVQSYGSSNPNTVFMYLCDDYANTTCSSLNSWGNANGIINAPRFSNAAISMTDYGDPAMPKIVVLGGTDHNIFFIADNAVNATDLQNGINAALLSANINEQSGIISSLVAFPNPASNEAAIKFNLAKSTDVSVEIFNLVGKKVATISSGKLSQGENKIQLNTASYASGIYLAKLSDGTKSKFMNLVVSH